MVSSSPQAAYRQFLKLLCFIHMFVQDAIIPAVGVAVTMIPGLVRESQDEVDTAAIDNGEDRPGPGLGNTAALRIRDIIQDLVNQKFI